MRGYGWCVLRAVPPPAGESLERDPDRFDSVADEADEQLWHAVRQRMAATASPSLQWHLAEHLNDDRGVLLFHVARNHTSSEVMDTLAWIGEHGPGSYGLVHIHDDEDDGVHRRPTGVDRSNVFRVLRLRDGLVTELDDPFLGPIWPPDP